MRLQITCVSFLLLIGWVGGCAQLEEPTGVDLAAGIDLPPPAESEGILPAYETQDEQDNKADYLTLSGTYESIYGFTEAPPSGSEALPEWELTDGVLVAWDDQLSPFFAYLVGALTRAAPVYIVTPSPSYSRAVGDYLSRSGVSTANVAYFEYEHDAFWTRDFGPITIARPSGGAGYVDTQYYAGRRRDDAVPTLLGGYFGVPVYRPYLSSEGGNLMTNGDGLCVMTTWMFEENPYLSQRDVQTRMESYFGCEQIVVLERVAGEGTGHVDMFAKFTQPDTVLVGQWDSYDQPTNAAILDRNAAVLAGLRLPSGRNLRVVRIPMPDPDPPTYASYTNSLIVNRTAIVPTYSWARHLESAAVAAYREALPSGYSVLTVDSSEIIYYGGAVHCTAMAFNTATTTTTDAEPTAPAAESAYTAEPNAPISDGRTTESSINVPSGAGSVVLVRLEVDIAHSYLGDLTISLVHGSREAVLYRGSGAGSGGLLETFTTDAFSGAAADGTWTLRVRDAAERDEGTLQSWGIGFFR